MEDRAINIGGAINFHLISQLVPGKNIHYKFMCFISFEPLAITVRKIRNIISVFIEGRITLKVVCLSA